MISYQLLKNKVKLLPHNSLLTRFKLLCYIIKYRYRIKMKQILLLLVYQFVFDFLTDSFKV